MARLRSEKSKTREKKLHGVYCSKRGRGQEEAIHETDQKRVGGDRARVDIDSGKQMLG